MNTTNAKFQKVPDDHVRVTCVLPSSIEQRLDAQAGKRIVSRSYLIREACERLLTDLEKQAV